MKTQRTITKRLSSIILVLFAILFLSSCNSQSSKTKAPAIDIHTATVLGDINAIQQHIKAGSDLNIIEPTGGSTPLITATVFGKIEVAKALIEAGADINITNNDGSTPLYCAAFFCHTEIVELLLAKGADKNVRNNFGATALESVSGPFDPVKGIYDLFAKELGPAGVKLNYDQIKADRPKIAQLLR